MARQPPLSQAEVTRLRVRYRTEYEYAVERNCIEDGAHVSRAEVRQALQRLTEPERRVLRSRIRRRFRKLDDLMHSPRKTFEQPQAMTEDLPTAVALNNEMVK